jgi:asparagine synthase (glutamine-hydrolysing)
MCGIVGIFAHGSRAQPVDRWELVKMRDRMAARGPDGAGEWIAADSRVGFGHRRLSIIDPDERASQPMLSADGRLVITFNGEIYNYQALREELKAAGAALRTTSDTEVLLHLYARYGAEMVRRLRGMFTFGIWDEAKQRLLLARDPYGIKPLYTADAGGTFRFASQVKALLAGGGISGAVDPAGVTAFHLFGSVPEPFTLYRDIRALPAGHIQWVDKAGPRTSEPFANLAGILADGREQGVPPAAELPARVRAAVGDSVRAHLVADVEVGSFLSAGVDSGAVLGLMRDAQQRRIRAITLAFDEYEGTPQDEAPLAARVAAQYGVEHIVRRIGKREFEDDLPAILDAMDQPSIDGINTWFVAKAAKEAGLKVALSGIGGDELLAGYPSFVDLPRWKRRYGPFARIPGFGSSARMLLRALAPNMVRERPKALGMFEYAGTWAGTYLLRRGLFLPHELTEIMDPALAEEGLRQLAPLGQLTQSLSPDPGSDIGRVCALESGQYLRNQLLRDADWAGMAHGIEIRTPLVDAELLRSLAPIIPALRPGTGKMALAAAPSLPLPGEIVARSKTGFGVPIGVWTASAAAALSAVHPPHPAAAAGTVSRRWSRAVLDAFQNGAWPPKALRPGSRPNTSSDAVLIFRIGSIGDTVVALPCFHRIAQSFSGFRRILVTDISVRRKAAPAESILGQSGLIDDVIRFPPPPRRLGDFLRLRAAIGASGAKMLVYIGHRSALQTFRDTCFFRACGVRRIIGASLMADQRKPRRDPLTSDVEQEAARLARSLSSLGPIDLDDPARWDLRLCPDERRVAETALAPVLLAPVLDDEIIAISVGGKERRKDWGDANWRELLRLLAANRRRIAVVFIGAAEEFDRCEDLARAWPGRSVNLCGRLTPRESAAAMQCAALYLGHDCGPMHLAAAVGTPCVAIFGDFNKPRRWHPIGPSHRVIHDMRGIERISPASVYAEVSAALSPAPDRARRTVAAAT